MAFPPLMAHKLRFAPGLGNMMFVAASLYGLARSSGRHTVLYFPNNWFLCRCANARFRLQPSAL